MGLYRCGCNGKSEIHGATIVVSCSEFDGQTCVLKLDGTTVKQLLVSSGAVTFSGITDIGDYVVGFEEETREVSILPTTVINNEVISLTIKKKKYLYKDGDECTSVSGGWTHYYNNWYKISGSKNSNCLKLYYQATEQGSAASGFFKTNSSISRSGYDYLCVETTSSVSDETHLGIGTCADKQSGYLLNYTLKPISKNVTNQTIKIPISEIGTYPYICLFMEISSLFGASGTYINFYKVWLE